MGFIQVEKTINAPVAKVYAIARDIERLPEVVPDLTEVRVLERSDDHIVSTWRGTVSIAGLITRALYWKESDYWNDTEYICTFSLIEGDMKKYNGDWSFTPCDNDAGCDAAATLVRLTVDFELGVPMLGPLVVRLIDKLMKENCEALLNGIAKLAEN